MQDLFTLQQAQTKNRLIHLVALIAILLAPASLALAQLTPSQAAERMGRGINMGNTLEPPREGEWNNGPMQEYYFDDYKAAGFKTVRVPVRWDEHTATSPPYKIDDSWMTRVEQAVDWGLARGLFIIINAHHEEWIKSDYENPATRARFDSVWVQVARHFQSRSDSLFFEIINEPFGLTKAQTDDLNARILGIIRETNPTRLVIFSGHEWSNAEQLLEAAIPDPDDPYLLAYYHSYDPWDFAGQAQGTWGSDADRQAVADKFKSVADWSSETGIPVMISEFGAIRTGDFNSRMRHYATYVEESILAGIPFQVWDDGGDFQVYLREDRDWNRIKDVLLKSGPGGPTGILVSIVEDSTVSVQWELRNAPRSALWIERAVGDGAFQKLADLGVTDISFVDESVEPGLTYYYRIVQEFPPSPSLYSYPARVYVRPFRRTNYDGTTPVIPGVIEAEHFDVGGEGLTYHDTTPENITGGLRPDEGVDIEPRDDGGFHVGYVEPGEWFETTVLVEEAGRYDVTAELASLDGGGSIQVRIGNSTTRIMTVPKTDSWMNTGTVSRSITLTEGEQIMRVTIAAIPHFNIDRISVEKSTTTSAETDELPDLAKISVYPNPAQDTITIDLGAASATGLQVVIVDAVGRTVMTQEITGSRHTLSTDALAPGLYGVRLQSEAGILESKTVVIG